MFKRPLMTFMAAALSAYAGFTAYLFFNQRSLMYFGKPRKVTDAPLMLLERPDAEVLVTVREQDSPHAFIYFGGNAEDVSANFPDFSSRFPNHTLYLMHYRSYGGSEGKPSETALMEDAFALFDEVAKRHSHIVVAGRSLGTGIAVRIAAQRPVDRLVLITPYDSIENIAASAFPYMPVRWLLKDKYESWQYAPDISAPTLILMAGEDEVIPAASTERLYAFFREGVATLQVIPGARHNTIPMYQTYRKTLAAFVNGE